MKKLRLSVNDQTKALMGKNGYWGIQKPLKFKFLGTVFPYIFNKFFRYNYCVDT
jgi:hypothetical protein